VVLRRSSSCHLVGPLQLAVAQPPQHRLDPAVASFVILRRPKRQHLRAFQHLPHLLHGAHLRFVHLDHH